LVVFVLVEVVSFAILFHVGMRSWFRWDDWDFLATRSATDLHGLLVPHGDHWSTVPIFTYRTLWQVFGLRFAPYLFTAIALHLTSAALLRVVIRRAGVGPWIATAAASLFALFGAGYENTMQLMGLNFGGWPIVFGLTYLILVDHDGPFDWRDWVGLAAGLGALASSGLGVPMVAAVGAAAFLRRGLRVAMTHMLPLAAAYLAWYLAFAPEVSKASFSTTVDFVWRAARGVLLELGQSGIAAIALALVLAVGLALAWRSLPLEELRARASLPAGLLIGAFVFFVVTGHGRGDFPEVAQASHYMAAAAVMVLPALAVATQALSDRFSAVAVVAPLVFLVGIPGNLSALEDAVNTQEALMRRYEQVMLTAPRAPLAAAAPRSLKPEPILATPATVGWLRDALAAGRLPRAPQPHPPTLDGQIEVRLSLRQTNGIADWAPCRKLRGPTLRELAVGEHVSLGRGFVKVALLRDSGWTSGVTFGDPFGRFYQRRGETLTAIRGPLRLRITPVRGADNWFCG
jgi:hypothetical protein